MCCACVCELQWSLHSRPLPQVERGIINLSGAKVQYTEDRKKGTAVSVCVCVSRISLCTRNSSLDGATELKVVPFCSP